MKYNNIPWNDTIKKEARGIDDADFGEIQSVDPEYVLTQKGIIDKEFFSFPIKLAQDYDGDRVIFKVTEEEARNSYMQSQNIDDASSSDIDTENTATTNDLSLRNSTEEVISLMSEDLDVEKSGFEDETAITKKPVKETKTVEVKLIREKIESMERRPPSEESEVKAEDPVQSPKEIKISLRREEPEVTKRSYVKEEVVVKKKIVTDKKEITEEVTSEELDSSNLEKRDL